MLAPPCHDICCDALSVRQEDAQPGNENRRGGAKREAKGGLRRGGVGVEPGQRTWVFEPHYFLQKKLSIKSHKLTMHYLHGLNHGQLVRIRKNKELHEMSMVECISRQSHGIHATPRRLSVGAMHKWKIIPF